MKIVPIPASAVLSTCYVPATELNALQRLFLEVSKQPLYFGWKLRLGWVESLDQDTQL